MSQTPEEEIAGENYRIHYQADKNILLCSGCLRLLPVEYKPLHDLLDKLSRERLPALTLDFRQLEYLNSTGMALLAHFIADIGKQENTRIRVLGQTTVAWQKKSLTSLLRLAPSLDLTFD